MVHAPFRMQAVESGVLARTVYPSRARPAGDSYALEEKSRWRT